MSLRCSVWGCPLSRVSSMAAASRPMAWRGVLMLASLGVMAWPMSRALQPAMAICWGTGIHLAWHCSRAPTATSSLVQNRPSEVGVAGHGLLQQLAAQGEAGGLLGQQVLAIQTEVRHRLVVALHPQLGTHVEARPQVDHLAPSRRSISVTMARAAAR